MSTYEFAINQVVSNHLLPDHGRGLHRISRAVPSLFELSTQETGNGPEAIRSLILNGALMRLDIKGFSTLNEQLTSISPIETIPQRFAAFALLNDARRQDALMYEDIALQQARNQSNVGQQKIIDGFNRTFTEIEKILNRFGGYILDIEGDALNIYFPTLHDEENSMMRTHFRSLTAAIDIQKYFSENETLRARIGVRPTRVNEQALQTASGHLIFLTGEPFEELCNIESGAATGAISTSWNYDDLLPPEIVSGGKTIRDFIPASPIEKRKITLEINKLEMLLSDFELFKKETIRQPRNIPATVSYFAISGITAKTIEETQKRIGNVNTLLIELENKYGINILKTGIDNHGNVTFIAIHDGQNGNMAQQSVEALLYLKNSINAELSIKAGIATGTAVRATTGALHRTHDDIMGMAVNAAARIEQNIESGIAIDGETAAQLRALGKKPKGVEQVLHNIKGFVRGLSIITVDAIEEDEESAALLKTITSYDALENELQKWVKAHNQKYENDFVAKIVQLVRRYCGRSSGDNFDQRDQGMIATILFPLLEEMRSGATLFQIQRVLATQTAKSSKAQEEIKRLEDQYGEAIYAVAALTGGSDLPFGRQTAVHIGTQLNIPIEKYLEELKNNGLLEEEDDHITVWPAFQRRAYEEKTDKRKLYHQTITNYLQLQVDEKPELHRSIVFHAMYADSYEVAQEYLPRVIANCKETNDWEGVMLYGQWLAECAQKTNSTNQYIQARSLQGQALLTFGDFKKAYTILSENGFTDFDNHNTLDQMEALVYQIYASFKANLPTSKTAYEDIQRVSKKIESRLKEGQDFSKYLFVLVQAYLKEAEIASGSGKNPDHSIDGLGSIYKNATVQEANPIEWALAANVYALMTKDNSIFSTVFNHLATIVTRQANTTELLEAVKIKRRYSSIMCSLRINQVNYVDNLNPAVKRDLLNSAYEYAKISGNFRLILDTVNNSSYEDLQSGLPAESIYQRIQEGITIAQTMPDFYMEANLENNLALYYLAKNNFEEAFEHFEISYRIFCAIDRQNEGIETIRDDSSKITEIYFKENEGEKTVITERIEKILQLTTPT